MILKAGNIYFAYATGPQGGERDANILVRSSKDLKTWSEISEALPEKPKWAIRTSKFWAPHVVKRNNKFIMFYSAEPDSAESEHMRIGIAESKKPEGPFVDRGFPLDTGDAEENIDPMVFRDHLYWGRNGIITVQKLS